jgi:hypothetical protein
VRSQHIYISISLWLCLYGIVSFSWAQNNSILATGNWFKFSVTADGVYKIDYNQLRNVGINPEQINPKKIKIFTSYNGMLPQANSSPIDGELKEIPILVAGEADDRFNSTDFILFFAKGPDKIEYNSVKGIFEYENNLYADKNYFFLTIAQENGKRITDLENSTGGFPVVNTFEDFAYYETEKYNLLKSGRQWFGEQFDAALEATIRFNIAGIVESSEIKLVSQVMAQSIANSSFQVFINNNAVLTQPVSAIPNTAYGIKGRIKTDTISLSSSSINASAQSNQDVKYRFTKGGSGLSVGYLDFFLLSVKRKLNLYGDQTIFRSMESILHSTSTFEISSAPSDLSVWNVTNYYDVKNQQVLFTNSKIQFSANSGSLQTYVMFNASKAKAPAFESKIQNQNLHQLSPPSLLIITHSSFLSQAERLATHRQTYSGISASAVTTDQIYNEFSGGKQDISAIRNFIRYTYNQPTSSLKNVLLFGRGSYDYKNRVLSNTNYVPIYESRNSLSPLETYSSDDYYGFLENSEGEWAEFPAQQHTLEIGIGRLPVKTSSEAQQVVDKLIDYDTNKSAAGSWQNEFIFVGDDGDFNIHQNQADQLANSIEQYDPVFTARKFYLDNFEQIERPNGQFSPAARKALDLEIKRSALIVNYNGHGSERVWMDERILDESLIQNWKQGPKYPLFLTATCEFGRNDDPLQISSGEYTLLQKNGGSIGLVTTARPVSANTNFTLNKAFYEAFFIKLNNQFRDLGSIVRDTKNNSLSGVSNRNFSLLGDPSMNLALYQNQVVIDEIKKTDNSADIQALSKVTVSGHIENNSEPLINYNGVVNITLYDEEKESVTKGDENPPYYYFNRNNVLFRGSASVSQGTFQLDFVTPKNSPQLDAIGKLSSFAYTKNGEFASGGVYQVLKAGVDQNALIDTASPIIRLFMGDTTFINGGIVGPNTKIVALISDESGINISAFPEGNSIIAQIDENEQIVLNDYYKSNTDNYKKGTVTYPLDGLEKGKHTLTLLVSDTHNNQSIGSVDFIVTDGTEIEIEEYINYPNPFYESTILEFTHTRPGEDLEAIMSIYDMSGKILLTQQFNVFSSQYRVTLTEWDGKTANGTKLSNGIYLSKLSIRSLVDGSKNEQITKLIILN